MKLHGSQGLVRLHKFSQSPDCERLKRMSLMEASRIISCWSTGKGLTLSGIT